MANSAPITQDLTVKGESIERVYGSYAENRFIVNRRYQRKLIWKLEEKISFIVSIIRGYPVPIILLAENKLRDQNCFEIIDGMQRLNAITSFIENEYSVRGVYFDLNTTATTKAAMDSNILTQKHPVMDRADCVRIASYLLPLSIYEFADATSVDDVFRRINSGGRKLSRQELRTAGSTGHFAQAVRKISAKVRGDDSHSDVLRLSDMKKISITSAELNYGISVDSVFWVSQGILTKDQVRESRDEELVADMLAYMVLETPYGSRSEYLDDFYDPAEDEARQNRFQSVEAAVQKRTSDLVTNDFQRTFDELALTLNYSGKTFGQLFFSEQPERAPRYFQAVFLALHQIVVREQMAVRDRTQLIKAMENSCDRINIPKGSRWGAEDRQRTVQMVAGLYRHYFEHATQIDPATIHWVSRLENLLSQSYTEQSAYDFKQGFLRLDDRKQFDDASFEKILQTCTGIANIRRGIKGYILVGIVEKKSTAGRIKELFGSEPRSFERFYVAGVEHEANAMGKNLDQMFQMIIEKIKTSPLSPPLRDFITRHLKPVRYYDKTVFVFEIEGQEDPSSYNGQYFTRHGANLDDVKLDGLASFMRRYILGQ